MQDIGMRGDHVEEQIKLASAQAIIRNQELLRLEARKRDKSDKVLALFHQETKAKLDNIKDMQLGAKEQAASRFNPTSNLTCIDQVQDLGNKHFLKPCLIMIIMSPSAVSVKNDTTIRRVGYSSHRSLNVG